MRSPLEVRFVKLPAYHHRADVDIVVEPDARLARLTEPFQPQKTTPPLPVCGYRRPHKRGRSG
jgi:hypothetical protein